MTLRPSKGTLELVEHEPIITEPALRHGVSESDMLHALDHYLEQHSLDDGIVMFVGPSVAGHLLEVGVIEWYEELAIVHAMPAERSF